MILDVGPSTDQAMTAVAPERTSRATPIARVGERDFGLNEIFFSTTDRRGIIRSGNRVFARVSAYSRAELLGSPHNIIRHPDMPRAVFKLLWEEIEAGRPIAAYVKNLAKDGRYYWVMATVVPYDDGYLSVRIKPSTPFFAAARDVYGKLLALEQAVENGDVRQRKPAIDASKARLGELLGAAGFPSYEAFMRSALLAEVKSREASIRTGPRPASDMTLSSGEPGLLAILDSCAGIGVFLDGLVAKLDTYIALNHQLAEKARYVVDLAEDVRLFSINALLAATRVEGGAATLGTVATIMRSRSDASGPVFQALTDDVAAAIELLNTMLLPVAATKLQAEMMTVFVRELLDKSSDLQATAADLGALAQCLARGIDRLEASLTGLEVRMRALREHVATLQADLSVMRALELNGRIEAARATEAEAVVTLFRTIADQVRTARGEMDSLAAASRTSFTRDAAEAQRGRGQIAAIRRQIEALGLA